MEACTSRERQEEQDAAGMRERLHQLQTQLLMDRTLLGTASGGLQVSSINLASCTVDHAN